MAAWQHDYRLLPQSKLKEYYGKIPETISEDDYNKFDWWTGAPKPDPLEIEKILSPTENWSEMVKIWGSDRGNRLSLYHSESGELRNGQIDLPYRSETKKFSVPIEHGDCRGIWTRLRDTPASASFYCTRSPTC